MRLFGTDGVRGIANRDLCPELAFRLGWAGARVLTRAARHKPTLVVGRDTRISGPLLEKALVAGINGAGADVLLVGVVPTPAVAFLTRHYGADGGVVISASHNSFEYNGIKFFSASGYKLPDELEDEIETEMDRETDPFFRPIGADIGRTSVRPDAADDYVQHLKHRLGLDLSGLKIGIDCAHGALSGIAPPLFADLGAEVATIGDRPDGLNINAGVGSTHMGKLVDLVRSQNLDLGFAFDGDADRMLAVDGQGELADGDVILAILAADLKRRGRLPNDTLVVTEMSNLGLDIMAEKNGIQLVKTRVGDRYVLEAMLEGGYELGGEQSGHVILSRHSTTGDGLLSALSLLRALQDNGERLEEARQRIRILPQVLHNAKVPEEQKKAILSDPQLTEIRRRMETQLDGRGRLLVRASGTEPIVRVMLEGEDLTEIDGLARQLVDLIEERCRV